MRAFFFPLATLVGVTALNTTVGPREFSIKAFGDFREAQCDENYLHGGQRWTGPKGRFQENDVVNLAIARTGSESLTIALKENHQPSHHNHDCSLAALASLGARQVVTTIRHPFARLASGFQRRMDTGHGTAKSRLKSFNREFVAAFGRGGLDSYVKALRIPEDPNHATALAVTFGPGDRQSFMMPLVGFYLGHDDPPRADKLRTSGKALEIELRFVCTSNISDHFVKAGKSWGLRFSPVAGNTQQHHQSPVSSEAATRAQPSRLPGARAADKTPPADTSKLVSLSDESKVWLERAYAGDVDLFGKHCGDNSLEGGSYGESVAVYLCPSTGSLPGSCVRTGSRSRGRRLASPPLVNPLSTRSADYLIRDEARQGKFPARRHFKELGQQRSGVTPHGHISEKIDLFKGDSHATSKEPRSNFHTSITANPVLSEDDVAKPFSVARHIALKAPVCNLPRFNPNDITNLAVARTGSQSLNKYLKLNSHPSQHLHDCTLDAKARSGARRVIVSLRHPVARFVSGYQRRLDKSSDTVRSRKRPANVLFREMFEETGLDDYITALRDPSHAKHRAALECTYGAGDRQSYVLPVVGFYLGGPCAAYEIEKARQGGYSEVEVRFACTSTLTADFIEAGKSWGTHFTASEEVQKTHQSGLASDRVAGEAVAGEIRRGNNSAPTAKTMADLLKLRNETISWVNSEYSKDVVFYEAHCGKERAIEIAGGPLGSSVAVYLCPRNGRPGSCIPSGQRASRKPRPGARAM